MNVKSIEHGAIAGIVGGIVFGVMMGMMGMLPMIGQMVGSPTVGVGFFVHLIISAFIGGSFALLFQTLVKTGRPGSGTVQHTESHGGFSAR